ncbi:MAG: YlxR family protein [Nocardiopsaceae bacterium]|nr:YlxR family protein [Nocardiopsaceae bacterium]
MTARSERPRPERARPESAQLESAPPGSFPVRTCVGCKERAAKSSLLRLVADGGDIVPDPRARRPGRGAYLHPSLDCLDKARRRRALPRALRATGPLGTGPIASYLSRADVPDIT